MIYTLYKSTNIKNSKFYIGVHKTEDVGFGTDTWIDDYIGSGKWVKNVLSKYGRESFLVEVIAYYDSEDFAYDAESDLVTEEWLKENGRDVYNITPGGNKPPKMTKEAAIKSNKTRMQNGNPLRGTSEGAKKGWSEERRAAACGEGNPMFGVHRYGEDSPHFGKPQPESMKKEHSERMKGNQNWKFRKKKVTGRFP